MRSNAHLCTGDKAGCSVFRRFKLSRFSSFDFSNFPILRFVLSLTGFDTGAVMPKVTGTQLFYCNCAAAFAFAAAIWK
jgi:hypothetical protein